MSDFEATPPVQAEALPDDYPGKTAVFPAPIERLIYGIFGVQSRVAGAGLACAHELEAHFSREQGPGAVEQLRYTDAQGAACDVYLAFWSDPERYEKWFAQPAVHDWWQTLAITGPVGVWREVINAHKDRYQYGAGVPEPGGISVLGKLVACDKFGYWGGYRDRVPASAHDDFAPELNEMPSLVVRETLGRRLSTALPNNLCFIREGQGWDKAGTAERGIWTESMEPVVERWVKTLRDEPLRTGCISLRHCREWDTTTKTPLKKKSQLAFLLSLKHIERAARTTHAHLAVKKTFTDMYTEPEFCPRMHIWVEMLIVKRGELVNEYVNCDSMTGFLPYFEPWEVG